MSKDDTKTLLSLCGDLFTEDVDRTLTIQDLVFSHLNKNIPTNISITNTSRYERRGMLGQGGMGAVHEAYDKILHRQVATKSLHKDVPLESSLWKRFYREAQITAQLAHPSIVPVYSIEFNDAKQPLLIMKRIQGVTLADYIQECQSYQGDVPLLYRLEQRLEILIKIWPYVVVCFNSFFPIVGILLLLHVNHFKVISQGAISNIYIPIIEAFIDSFN